MRLPLVAGIWKLNGSRDSAVALALAVDSGIRELSIDSLICPTYVHLEPVLAALRSQAGSKLAVGAQNCSDQASGAYTGEIAGDMLKELGASFVILGHSERRHVYGETDEQVAGRVEQALASGLTPILCVGETKEQRAAQQTFDVVGAQMAAVVQRCGIAAVGNMVIAYEPVWAIGTGETATPEQAQEIHHWLRQWIARQDEAVAEGIRMLYGGSVKPANAQELFSQPDIDGGLIGGAALDADDFVAICRAAQSR